jgi:hypothetical protein
MGAFGKYRIRANIDHFVLGGHEQDYSFAAGDLEPADADEQAALDQLCRVSYTSPDGSESYTFAELLEPADPPAPDTPADETPADETPADETPADETPADETPAGTQPGVPTGDEPVPTGGPNTPAADTPATTPAGTPTSEGTAPAAQPGA